MWAAWPAPLRIEVACFVVGPGCPFSDPELVEVVATPELVEAATADSQFTRAFFAVHRLRTRPSDVSKA
jgi:hypothetical protein